MKQANSVSMLLLLSLSLFFISCGGDGSKDETTTDTSTNTTNTSTSSDAMPVNTIVTTPQAMVVVRHKVADYDKWLVDYEAHDSARRANGIHNYVIGRGHTDPNMVLIALRVDDIAKAKAFASSAHLKQVMQKAGVQGPPMMTFTNATWQDTANIGNALRSISEFTVKDYDAWVKSFMDGKQERMDNGIVDRVISHEADDNKKIRLVTAVMDTTKAFAYYKSDALKKRREAGGVQGDIKRFLFNITKRY